MGLKEDNTNEDIQKHLIEIETYIMEDEKFFLFRKIKKIINSCLSVFGIEVHKIKDKTKHSRPALAFIQDRFIHELVGVEIGVQKGVNAREIFDKLKIKRLYLIDLWKEIELDTTQKYMDIAYKNTLKRLKP